MKRKTHEEYVAELAVKRPDLTVVGEYTNTRTKITHRCAKGHQWDALPKSILNIGSGCPRCSRKKTHDQYVAELAVKNPGVTVVGEYVTNCVPITHRCKQGHEWKSAPNHMLRGSGCSRCHFANRKKTHDDYVAQLAKVNPSVQVLGTYINSATAIEHQCGRCGEIWSVTPHSLLSRKTKGCRSCSGMSKKTHAEYVAEVNALGKGITVVGEYINNLTPIAHCCSKGHKWDAAPSNILGGRGCPQCSEIATDANVFYCWQNGEGTYKVGITSERCAEERIKQCARSANMTPRVVLMLKTPRARDIERRALELGDDPRYPETIDGYTEFRRYSDAELGEVWRMAVGA